MPFTTVNLEAGLPTVDAAMRLLQQAVVTCKSRRTRVLKIIHGYGSSGTGGKIKTAVAQNLRARQAKGEIRAFARGEEFDPFCDAARQIVSACPALAKDRDYGRCNHGVTFVLLF